MKKATIWFIAITLSVMEGCSSPKYITVPVEETKVEVVRDTVRITDTITVTPPLETRTVVPSLDTLRMELDGTEAICWNDSTVLRGFMKSQGRTMRNHREERISEKSDTVVITKSVPVEVEKPLPYVPRLYRWLSIWGGLSLVVALLWLYSKFKGWRR